MEESEDLIFRKADLFAVGFEDEIEEHNADDHLDSILQNMRLMVPDIIRQSCMQNKQSVLCLFNQLSLLVDPHILKRGIEDFEGFKATFQRMIE